MPSGLETWVEAGKAAEGLVAFAEARQHFERPWTSGIASRTPRKRSARPGWSSCGARQRMRSSVAIRTPPRRSAERDRARRRRHEPMLAGMLHDRLARYLWDTKDQPDALAIQRRAVALVPTDPPSKSGLRSSPASGASSWCSASLRRANTPASGDRDREDRGRLASRVRGHEHPRHDRVHDRGCRCRPRAHHRCIGQGPGERGRVEQMRGYWNLFANAFCAARWEDALVRFRDAADALPRLGQGHLVPELQVTAADCLVRLGRGRCGADGRRCSASTASRRRADPAARPGHRSGTLRGGTRLPRRERHRAAGRQQGARGLAANQPRRDRRVGRPPRCRPRAGRRGARHRREAGRVSGDRLPLRGRHPRGGGSRG